MLLDWRHRVAALVAAGQLLLALHTYRSTDFEVHRNWLAITHSLPLSQWYVDATSEWTLDYPPLFAWFEWAMARAAAWADPAMLVVGNLGHASTATVAFQRASVAVTSLVLVAAMLRATAVQRDSAPGLTAFALVVANAGLIMVDNIHFQYNSVLMGLLLFSVLALEEQRWLLGGALFAVLLNMKHLFAYLAPVYFVLMLKHYVLHGCSSSSSSRVATRSRTAADSSSWLAAARRLALLGGCVLLVCVASLGPFAALGQLGQLASRLFPFARGLCHAYWAPNAWALYSFADKVAAAAATRAGLLLRPAAAANMAGGVVGVSSYLILPNVGAGATAAMVLAALVPCLVALWRAPSPTAALRLLAPAVAYANLSGFVWGYHVHEKAALTATIPLALVAARPGGAQWAPLFVVLSSAAHVGIFPLLFQAQEVPIRWALALLYYLLSVWGLASIHGQGGSAKAAAAAATGAKQRHQPSSPAPQLASPARSAARSPGGVRTRRQAAQRQQQQPAGSSSSPGAARSPAAAAGSHGGPAASMHACCSWLPLPHRLYLGSLVVVELYGVLGHAVLMGGRLPFVPLMLTSVSCALGVVWAWAWMARWFVRQW